MLQGVPDRALEVAQENLRRSHEENPPPLKGEEEECVDLCVICLVNVPDAQLRPRGHSMICRYCTQELIDSIRALPDLP